MKIELICKCGSKGFVYMGFGTCINCGKITKSHPPSYNYKVYECKKCRYLIEVREYNTSKLKEVRKFIFRT